MKDLFLKKCLGFFLEKKLITLHQFGFRPDDSCINQLLSITHEIHKNFDDRLEVRRVFLDISKAFYKVSKVAFLVTCCTFLLIF